FTPAENNAMGGMIAGGEMMYGTGVFLLVALVPTALALWFVRRSRAIWSALSGAALSFAIVGLAAVLLTVALHGQTLELELIGLFGIVQMFGSPIWAGGFALFSLLAPARDLRRRLLVATAIEVVVGAIGAVTYLLPRARS